MMRMRWVADSLLLLGMGAVGFAQDEAPQQPPFVAQITDMLKQGGSGHSPTSDEIMAVESESGLTNGQTAQTLEPLLKRALTDPDAAMRQYGLAMLVGVQTLPESPAAAPGAAASAGAAVKPNKMSPAQPVPAVFQADVARAIAPLIPLIGARLTDEDPQNRELAATDLGGFAPNPPASVYIPLLDFLKRDDAVGPVGLAVVVDLLQIGPVNDDTAAAITRYLRRSDQTIDSRSNLVEAIAGKPNQSQAVDKALLGYLDSDDDSLRSRVILSLPAFDLPPDVFAQMKTRVSDIASGGQDSLQVVNAAKSVAGCWTQVKMATGCPVY